MKAFIVFTGLFIGLGLLSCAPKECSQEQINDYNQALDGTYDVCKAYVAKYKEDCTVKRTDPKRGPHILEGRKMAASCK
jgi:hypothetical protein